MSVATFGRGSSTEERYGDHNRRRHLRVLLDTFRNHLARFVPLIADRLETSWQLLALGERLVKVEVADFQHPPGCKLRVRAACGQQVQAPPDAPAEDTAQDGLSVAAGGALEPAR